MRIRPEHPRALSAAGECAVVGAAFARNPASAVLRLRLARLLRQLDRFDEAIAVLAPPDTGSPDTGPLDWDGWLMLATAYFARDDAGDLALAGEAAAQAAAAARTDAERAAARSEQGRVLLKTGDRTGGRARLAEALRLDPGNPDTYRRLATDLLRAGEAAAALDLTERLIAQGIGHGWLLALRTLALARLDRIDAAWATVDPGGFRHVTTLDPPPGWDDLPTFNRALIDELLAHPGMRYERHGTASRKTWRIDALATGASPLARTLLAEIAAAAERHVASLPQGGHLWLDRRPAHAILRSWCVITQGEGFERWHAHPMGWMSGVYYAQVPATIGASDDPGGCLAFGVPEDLTGAAAAARFGEELVAPHAGMLMLFPSHGFHRTFPHGADDRRVCVSFDILPA